MVTGIHGFATRHLIGREKELDIFCQDIISSVTIVRLCKIKFYSNLFAMCWDHDRPFSLSFNWLYYITKLIIINNSDSFQYLPRSSHNQTMKKWVRSNQKENWDWLVPRSMQRLVWNALLNIQLLNTAMWLLNFFGKIKGIKV